MSISLYLTVSDDATIQARFARASDLVRVKVAAALGLIGGDVAGLASALAPRRTGRLGRSIRSRVVEGRDGRITAIIRPNRGGWYGIFAEADQKSTSASVGSYVRRVAAGDVRAQLAQVRMTKSGTALVSSRRAVVSKGIAFVRPYTRKVHLHHQAFMRPSYDSFAGTIAGRLAAAVQEAVGGA